MCWHSGPQVDWTWKLSWQIFRPMRGSNPRPWDSDFHTRRAILVFRWVTAWEYMVWSCNFWKKGQQIYIPWGNVTSALVYCHIMLKTPALVWSLKLSNFEPFQYLDGWPLGNTWSCRPATFLQKGNGFWFRWGRGGNSSPCLQLYQPHASLRNIHESE